MLKCLSAHRHSRPRNCLSTAHCAFHVDSRASSTQGLWLLCFVSDWSAQPLDPRRCHAANRRPSEPLILRRAGFLISLSLLRAQRNVCTLYLVFKEPRLRQFTIELFGIPQPTFRVQAPLLPASPSFRWRPSGEPFNFTIRSRRCQPFFRVNCDFVVAASTPARSQIVQVTQIREGRGGSSAPLTEGTA